MLLVQNDVKCIKANDKINSGPIWLQCNDVIGSVNKKIIIKTVYALITMTHGGGVDEDE